MYDAKLVRQRDLLEILVKVERMDQLPLESGPLHTARDPHRRALFGLCM